MTAFERWSVLLTSIATTLTGVVYLWMKYLLPPPEPFSVVSHPLQPLVLKLHILVAPLLVFALGLVTLRHVWRHFRARVQLGRRTGILTAVVAAPMVVTGYLIQSITAPAWLRVVAWVHIGSGIVYVLGVAAHWWLVGKNSGRVQREVEWDEEHTSPLDAPARSASRRLGRV